MKEQPINKDAVLLNDAVLKELFESAKKLKFGQILITVHDGRIVQIDKTEKIRFPQSPIYEKGGGI
jgi:hypothetical protein